jgi:anti-sigma factor RsiW
MLSADSTFPASSPCKRAEALRDYAFDELPADERRAIEQHLATCGDCELELEQLRVTSAALRTLPDREIPQRIAFVSDRVFEPSPFRRFWSPGFASACVLGVALVISAWHFSGANRAAEVRTVAQTASASEINAAVAKAVAQVRAEDAQMIQTAIQSSERKRDQEYRDQLVAIGENFDVLKKRLNVTFAMAASSDGSGAGQ